MAHVAKFTRGAMGHMLSHYDRSKDGLGEHIDPERTPMNYNLAGEAQPLDQLEFIHRRLAEVKCQNRKDVNVLCDWVITAPKDLPEPEQEAFFRVSYAFLAEKYGEKNVVSAYVHMDETTPHMHFAFMPIVTDRKHPEREKVSAKETITRGSLQTFHEDLQRHVERELGHEVGILNEATREGNKSIVELKRKGATERLQEATAEASKIVSEARKEAKTVKDTLIPLKAEYEARRAFIDEADKVSDVSMMYPESAKVTEKGLFKKQKYVTVPAEVWEAKHVSANEKDYIKQAGKALDARIQEFQQTGTAEQISRLTRQVKALQREKSDLEYQVRRLQDRNQELGLKVYAAEHQQEQAEERLIGKINKVLSQLPEQLTSLFVAEWKRQDRQQERQHDMEMEL